MLGLSQVFSAILCEYVNIYMLSFNHTIQHSIIHFVSLHVVMEVKNMYFESLKNSKLKEVMHHPPKAIHKGKDIDFSTRPLFHKFARVLYKLLRVLFVGVIFYFIPYSVLIVQFVVKYEKYDAAAH
jgi:hypothetical protein